MKKTVILYILAFIIPVVLFVDAYQSFRYNALERDVSAIEQRQYEIIEDNKRSVSAISVMTVPGRIEMIAKTKLGMRRAKPEEILRIKLDTQEAVR